MKFLNRLVILTAALLGPSVLALSSSSSAVASGFGGLQDPVLDALIARALAQNPSLEAAAARVDQARALAGATRAEFYPRFAIEAVATRGQSLDSNYQTTSHSYLPGVASWELDFWGRVRKLNRSAREQANASEALYRSAQLSLAADVAQTYFTWQALREERTLLDRTLETRRESRRLIADRVELGASASADLAQAETVLALAQADLAAVEQRLAALEHALALLTGAEATDVAATESLDLEPRRLSSAPSVPAGLRADLLLARPDVQAAQHALNAASARIGVARAAFFPTIALTGSAGWESTDLSRLISGDTRVWSFGPSVYLPLFQGGRNRAELSRAQAALVEQAARYRETWLGAFRDVRDALSGLRWTAQQADALQAATTAARRAAALARDRYDAGSANYLEIVDSERVALDAERALARVRGQSLVTYAALLRAVGGVLK